MLNVRAVRASAPRPFFFSCARKIRHEARDSALAHFFDVLDNHGSDGHPLNVYHCRICGAWHVGRSRFEEP